MTVFTVSSHLLYDITYCSALSLFKSHYVYSRESHFQYQPIRALKLRQMLPRINNYIFPDEPIYHRWWWNCMRSSCWNAPVVLVLLGLIGGVCWASHGHTGLASDPKQLLSRQGLQLRMPNPKPCYSPGRHFWKTLLWPLKGLDPAVKALWRILLGKAPVFSWSDFEVSYFQQTNIPLCLQHTNAEFTDNC